MEPNKKVILAASEFFSKLDAASNDATMEKSLKEIKETVYSISREDLEERFTV